MSEAQTITLDMRIFVPRPPEHSKYYCLCDDCWHEYLDWCDRQYGDQ